MNGNDAFVKLVLIMCHSASMDTSRRALSIVATVAMAAGLVAISASPAYAASGDVLARGTVYCADSYTGHARASALSGPDPHVVDINFPNDLGKPVYAPDRGTVSASWSNAGGNMVTWRSADGRESLTMAHLGSVGRTGTVNGGDQIGTVGNTGAQTTGPHLHISRTVDGTSQPVVLSGVRINPNFDRPSSTYGSCTGVTTYTSVGPISVPSALQLTWTNHPGTAIDVTFATVSGGWELFHVGTDNVIYRKILQNGTGTGWMPISGPRALKVAATTSSDGRVELFYIGMNNQVYHHWESSPGGNIGNWEGLGGYATEITAARSGGSWEVFHRGGNNTMWRATQGNHAWRQLPGQATALSAATSRDGRVELFHIGLDRNIYHAWQSSSGSAFGSWDNIGSGSMSKVAATSVGNGEWEVFAVDTGGRMWRKAPWSGVNNWQAINGWATTMAAAKSPDGRVEVAHVGGTGSIWHAWQRSVGSF